MRTFIRHYLEMVAAMFVGMALLWMPARVALGAAGVGGAELHEDYPALMLAAMALTMTVPMVAWMRHRGHGRNASNEMAASMLVPTAGVLLLLAAGIVEDMGALMTIEHAVMFPAMLGVMLLRRDEYSGRHAYASQPSR